MIRGLGIDLFEVARMERDLGEKGDTFKQEIFTPDEIAYCDAMHHPAQHYAVRLAAKEAVIKALALEGSAYFFWRDVEIRREADGRPRAVLHGRVRELAERQGVRCVHVSLSHTRELALAAAAAES